MIEDKSACSSYPSMGYFDMYGKDSVAACVGGIFVFAIGVSSILYLRWTAPWPSQPRPRDEHWVVPFVILHDSVESNDADPTSSRRKPIGQILRSVLENYQRERVQALAGLSTMLDQALTSEANGCGRPKKYTKSSKWLSAKIERRIQRTAACLEHDERVLAKLLGNFSYTLALPDRELHPSGNAFDEHILNSKDEEKTQARGRNTNYRLPERNKITMNESETHSYDSATQIWAHIVRDWTAEGKAIRRVIYDWCYQQIERFCRKPSFNKSVLVPGSGMGRLAYDLSRMGYNVEANELSPSMAAAASSVLKDQISGHFHPYVLDSMANEVDSERRFDSITFPDVPIQAVSTNDPNDSMDDGIHRGSLSYTVGDFVGNDDHYYRTQRVGHFDAIVTCFFIDTATNIYEYLDTIQQLLKPGIGLWINVGPVQWHHNAILRPSVDELKDLIEACGWNIKSWSIDDTPISYRDKNDLNSAPRMTSYDGYRPLRFVAIRP